MTIIIIFMKIVLLLIKFIILFILWSLIISAIQKKRTRVSLISLVLTLFFMFLLYIPFEKKLLSFDTLDKAIKYNHFKPVVLKIQNNDNISYVFYEKNIINRILSDNDQIYKVSIFYKNQSGWKIMWPLIPDINIIDTNYGTVIFQSYSNPYNDDLVLLINCIDEQAMLNNTATNKFIIYDMNKNKFNTISSNNTSEYEEYLYGVINKHDDYITINNEKIHISKIVK